MKTKSPPPDALPSPDSRVSGAATCSQEVEKTPVEMLCEAFDKKCCPRCKCCEMDWQECEQCGGEGESEYGELYEEDPLYYDMSDTRRCDWCRGKGGHWHCSCDDNGKHATHEPENDQIHPR